MLLNKIIDDHDISDSIYGFHAQQAIENLLKAVLSLGKVEFKRTHNIRELMDLLADNGSPLPAHLHEIDILTAYGVLARYEHMTFTSSIDRRALRRMIHDVRAWADQKLS
jgi:HEPN domain-containing protein